MKHEKISVSLCEIFTLLLYEGCLKREKYDMIHNMVCDILLSRCLSKSKADSLL